MDLTNIVVAASSFVLSIGAVAAFVSKVIPKISKYIHIAKDVIDVTDTFISALKPDADGKIVIDKNEIDTLSAKIANFRADLKA